MTMQSITLVPRNEQQMRLIKQLAKTLEIEVTVAKTPKKETARQKKEREFLDKIERSAKQVKAHLEGKIVLKSVREVVDEL